MSLFFNVLANSHHFLICALSFLWLATHLDAHQDSTNYTAQHKTRMLHAYCKLHQAPQTHVFRPCCLLAFIMVPSLFYLQASRWHTQSKQAELTLQCITAATILTVVICG